MAALQKKSNKVPLREIIGRVSAFLWPLRNTVSVDATVADYVFWDKFRRAKAKGYEMASLIAASIAGIMASWVLGDGIKIKTDSDDDYTGDLVNRFLSRIKSTLYTLLEDMYSLGDVYLVLNPDGSVSTPSPDTVTMTYSPLDYRTPTAATITTTSNELAIIDQFRIDGRTVKITNRSSVAQIVGDEVLEPSKSVTLEYDNPLGVLPVVHFTNERSGNEVYGRPAAEALLPTLQKYDDLLDKAVSGALMLSNPIPVLEGVEDLQETIDANGEPTDEEYTDETGASRNRVRLVWDKMTAILLGKGGSFKFASPAAGFTSDIRELLKTLFLLIGEKSRIPDVVWGFELSSSRASASEQIKTFYMHVSGKRREVEGVASDKVLGLSAKGGIHQMIDVFLRWRALVDPQVELKPVVIEWPQLGEDDKQMRFTWATALYNAGIMSDATYATVSGLVHDPKTEIDAARADQQSKIDPYDAAMAAAAQKGDNADLAGAAA